MHDTHIGLHLSLDLIHERRGQTLRIAVKQLAGRFVDRQQRPVLKEYLEDRLLACRLSDAAQERAQLFDWQNVAGNLLDYYEELGA